MKRLLSTRTLNDAQKALLPEGVDFEEYDAIRITMLPVEERDTGERLSIFTSSNAVRACFEGVPESVSMDSEEPGFTSGERFRTPGCVCVGQKTAALLRTYGQHVLEVEGDATALSRQLIKKYNDQSFIHFCGNRRLDVLSRALAAAGIAMREQVVYRTDLHEQTFHSAFDAVLFFSPSGVESFTKGNTLNGATAVCIGPTTAQAAAEYTRRIIIASERSVEQVILAARAALA